MSEPERSDDCSEEQFLSVVEALCAANAQLTPLSAAIVAAPFLGIASDTRTFARNLGVEHALVLRELTSLTTAQDLLVSVTSQDNRTQRTFFDLTCAGQALLERVTDAVDDRSA